MDPKALLQERMDLVDKVYKHERVSRVPTYGNLFTWKYLDCGYNLRTALRDFDLMEKIHDEINQRYQFDAYSDVGTRNSMRVADALGANYTQFDPTGEYIVVDDVTRFMEADEYQEFKEDQVKFYWSKCLPRYSKPGLTLAEVVRAVEENHKFNQFGAKMTKKHIEEYGALLTGVVGGLVAPFETITSLRGIKEAAKDVRKRPEELKETMDALFNSRFEQQLQMAINVDSTGYLAPIVLGGNNHSLLSPKQFEIFYWPYLKKVVDAAIKHDKRIFLSYSSTILRFAEFLEEVPKGIMMVYLEQDDVYEVRKRLPNLAICGGLPTSLLGYASKEECVEYTKRLIDTMGDGFMLSQDKMLSYRNDAKRENLMAVNEFARTYSY